MLKKLNRNTLLYILLFFFVILKLFITIKLIDRKATLLVDGDNFVPLFERFISNGAISEIQNGTSILYNLALSIVYFFVNDFHNTLLYFNFFCIFFLITFGIYILHYYSRHYNINYLYFITLSILYLFFILHDRLLMGILVQDDCFMGCIYLLILFIFIKLIIKPKTKYYLWLGALLGLCFGIRELPILHLPAIIFCLIFFVEENIKSKYIHIGYFFLILFFTIFIIHSPSILSGNGLSFYDKNPENGLNWIQKNHLAITKVNDSVGFFNLRPWTIWKAASFEDVEIYLSKNGKDSLPKSLTEIIIKEPVLLVKMSLFNIYYIFKEYIKEIGLLVFLPFLFLRKNVYWIWFLLYTTAIAIVAYSLIELRWFMGTEILLFLAILFALNRINNSIINNTLIGVSLLLIASLDIRYIIAELL